MKGYIISDIDFTQVKLFDEYKNMTARGYTPDRMCYIVFEDGSKEEINEEKYNSEKLLINESHIRQMVRETLRRYLQL